MTKNLEIFESDPIPKAVAKLAIPTVASMLVAVVYNMVDTFFVGKLGDPNQVAAVSIATPVFLFLMAAGNMFGMGGSSFISRSLGEKKIDKVRHISAFCFYGSIVVGLLGALLFLTCMPTILSLIGSSPATAPFAKEYLSYIAYGAPLVVLSTAYSNLVRGEGAANTAMIGMMSGTVANIILDPIMILTLKMGVAGAAIATVIGNAVSMAIYLVHIVGKKSLLSILPTDFRLGERIATSVVAIGLPASLTNILMSLSNIVLNNFLSGYGDIPVASMGVAQKANMLVIFLQMGLAAGVQPLIGFCYGAKNFKRMKGVMKFSMLTNLVIGCVMTTVYIFFSRQIISLFISDESVIETGNMMLKALMISAPVLGSLFIFNFSFQAMGKALQSLSLSVSRQGFVFLPLLFIGRSIAGLNGLIYAQPIADLVSIVIALCMFLYLNKSFKKMKS